jgi:hypothetical protein
VCENVVQLPGDPVALVFNGELRGGFAQSELGRELCPAAPRGVVHGQGHDPSGKVQGGKRSKDQKSISDRP